jgi:hypothetical protein
LQKHIIELQLTPDQTGQLAPLVREAVEDNQHALFAACAIPTIENGETVWKLQVVRIRQKVSAKIRKLLLDDGHAPETIQAIQ